MTGCVRDMERHLHSGQHLILGLSFFYEQWLGVGLWTELGEDWSDWSLYRSIYGIPRPGQIALYCHVPPTGHNPVKRYNPHNGGGLSALSYSCLSACKGRVVCADY